MSTKSMSQLPWIHNSPWLCFPCPRLAPGPFFWLQPAFWSLHLHWDQSFYSSPYPTILTFPMSLGKPLKIIGIDLTLSSHGPEFLPT